MLTRAEVGKLSDMGLVLAADRCRDELVHDWRRGQPGKLATVYELALVLTEALMRGLPVPAPRLPGQLELVEGYDD